MNAALKNEPQLQKLTLEQLIQISGKLPEKLQTTIRNNAGGVYNHRLFFAGLTPPSDKKPYGILIDEIERQFKSLDDFKAEFKSAAMSVFGSGYAWLVCDGSGLRIITTPNQNSPVEQGLCPILTIDVWEHAYYLKHYNVRAEYIDDWQRIIDWDKAEQNLLHCYSGRSCL